MLAFLGWNAATEQEIFSMEELIQAFSFDHVHKAGARFDPEKTKWFNSQWLLKKPDTEIASRLKTSLKKEFNFSDDDKRLSADFLVKCVQLLKPRVQFENEMISTGAYLFTALSEYDQQVLTKKWKPALLSFFQSLNVALKTISDFTAANIEFTFKQTAEANQIKPGEVLQLLRVFMSGQAMGVDLFPMIELLGKEEALQRLNAALKKID
jgi:glutamyl-tRNA synthetase